MAKMVATYERGKTLNVRSEPSGGAGVVRKMAPGDRAEVEEVRGGWAKLADGYVHASLVTIALSDEGPEPEHAEEPQPEAAAEPEPEPEPVAYSDETATLRKMTNPQLYDLAAQSGIKVKKGATKEELIAAILADA